MTTLRPERPEDHAAIHALDVACFPTAGEAELVDRLRANGKLHISLVALSDRDEIVGHIAFSPVTLDGNGDGIGLAPLAVAESHRREGIGAYLVQMGLQSCRHAGYGFVVVLGDPAYYGRFGFEPASEWSLRDEYGGGAAFQALELRANGIPEVGGLVRYASEFGELAD